MSAWVSLTKPHYWASMLCITATTNDTNLHTLLHVSSALYLLSSSRGAPSLLGLGSQPLLRWSIIAN